MISRQIQTVAEAAGPFMAFFANTPWLERQREPGVCNFIFGNPNEMPLPGFVDALRRYAEPQSIDWFAYKLSEEPARQAVAAALRRRLEMGFRPEDISMTTGAFAALAVALRALAGPGDEVIFLSPPWFFYEALIAAAGATPVRVRLEPPRWSPDPAAIAAAITPRTRAVILNSPHNPTGRIYTDGELAVVARVLEEAGAGREHPIFALSDEAYSRILFDGRGCSSLSQYYAHTLLIYTYGKTLLTPGQRLGYIALPPTMPEAERAALNQGLLMAQVASGYAFPNAILQYAVEELEQLSIDIAALELRRDRLAAALRDAGYEITFPEGTFYLCFKAPGGDDIAFANCLAEHGVLTLPGAIAEMPGWIRLSLTASDEMVEQAIPIFEQLAASDGHS